MKSWSKIQLESSGISLALSVLLNIILVVLTSLIFNMQPTISDNTNPLLQEKQYIKVKSFRTVGVKNGKKNEFSSPTKTQPSKSNSGKKSVNLSQLGSIGKSTKTESIKKPQKTQPLKFKNEKSNFSFTAKPPLKQRMRKQQQQLQGDVLKNLAANPSYANALSNKGFNVQFDPPEGIREDELNSIEKIFYSFQKRTYEKYLNSFLNTYYSTLTSNPNLRNDLSSDRHRLNARVQFDKNGFIISVKILKSSNSDSVHNLFETTLDKMRSIPNPPKDLLGKDGNFTIYYSLYIN